MRLPTPSVIAHCGASFYAPENTLPAIEKAHMMGASWVELDVRLTKDNIPVLFHDETVDRVTTATGKVVDIHSDELRLLDAGVWFGKGDYSTPIPTLQEAIESIQNLGMGLNLEIKPSKEKGILTADAVMKILKAHWHEKDRLMISSFCIQTLDRVRALDKDVPIALICKTLFSGWEDVVSPLGACAVNISHHADVKKDIEVLKAHDLMVGVYTINDQQQAQNCLEWGASYIFSDRPDILQAQGQKEIMTTPHVA